MHGATEVGDLCGAMGILEGYYLDNADRTCKPCQGNCATCTGSAVTNCDTCKVGYYLKSDKSCSDTCNQGYADSKSRTCKLCTTIDQLCAACKYNATVSKPQCTACNTKKVKTALDGTTTCVDVATGCKDENHFQAENNAACYLCGENASGSGNDKGIANCKTCTKSGAPPQCSACLDGYFFASGSCTTTCGTGCATCSAKDDPNKCLTCMAGFFLVGTKGEGQCVSCGDTAQGGIDGCAECLGTAEALKCTKCKPNRRSKGESGNYTCEEKTCEDDSACGGTAGACGAIVVGGDGSMKHYCSYCGESTKFPIDGICKSAKGNNTCDKGVCTQCASGYFLYMGAATKLIKSPAASCAPRHQLLPASAIPPAPTAGTSWFRGQPRLTSPCWGAGTPSARR